MFRTNNHFRRGSVLTSALILVLSVPTSLIANLQNEPTTRPTTGSTAAQNEATAATPTAPAVQNEPAVAPSTAPLAVQNEPTTAPSTAVVVQNEPNSPATTKSSAQNEATAAPTTTASEQNEPTTAPTTTAAAQNEPTAAPTTTAVATSRASTQPKPEPVLGKALVLDPVARPGRSPVQVDAVEAALVAGTWKPPQPGDGVRAFGAADGRERKWRELGPSDGTYADPALVGGWLYLPVDSPDDRVVILAASSHTMAYVNGRPRAGDPYETGFVGLPIQLRRGRNDLLFACGRGRLRVELKPVKDGATVVFWPADFTSPDFVRGAPDAQAAGVIIVNATTRPVRPAVTSEGEEPGPESSPSAPPPRKTLAVVPPMSVRKQQVTLRYRAATTRPISTSTLTMFDDTNAAEEKPAADTIRIDCRVREPAGESLKRTFVSDIDDSVQYYAVVPATAKAADGTKPALVLSLHGAAVEASGQADAYSAKPWCHIVCPTNRRPFGFDWEDWGRIDAIEVLDRAQATLQTDPARTYLTGHSMGGHGTWQLGSLFPDRFGAIGPSAGWLSFTTYATGRASLTTEPASRAARVAPSATEIFRRAALSSDTVALLPNLEKLGVYVLHGVDDDNVPVGQARLAAELLSGFHRDYVVYEKPGAGHWWDDSDEPGASCVDWAPMFDLFARRRAPLMSGDEVREVDFRTPNPGVSSRCQWLTIDAQLRPLTISRAHVRFDPGLASYKGDTQNVARLRIELSPVPHAQAAGTQRTIKVALDGATPGAVTVDADQHEVWLYRESETSSWRAGARPTPNLKRDRRTGPFKLAFANRMVFVYGTGGSEEENAATYAKARYDAEVWWYRANGSVDVVADADFSPATYAGRNVILYGNADTNSVWPVLLRDSPVEVRRGQVRVGNETETGEDLACLFVRPHPDSPDALVAAVGATGVVGTRLTNRLAYFTSGVGFPDWCVLGPEVLTSGLRVARGAGFFENDWSLSRTDSFWSGRAAPATMPASDAPATTRTATSEDR